MHTKAPHEQFYRYVIPAMASQLLTGFFIIVDGFFIGQSIGDVGLASIIILWPIAAVILATGLGIGSGGSVVMTHAMGAGDTEKALAARGNTLLCLGAATVLLTAALGLSYPWLLRLLGATGELYQPAADYTVVVVLAGGLQIFNSGLNPLLRGSGRTVAAMAIMIFSLLCNILLDWLFIAVFAWGMRGAGMIVMLLLVAVAVAMFISCGGMTSPYAYLEAEVFETEYGVSGMVRERQRQYRSTYTRYNVLGACLCILSAIPLFGGAFLSENGLFLVGMLSVMLLLIGLGVIFFIVGGVNWASMEKLLQEGDYTRTKKKTSSITGVVSTVYWCVAAAVYLACSLPGHSWRESWVIWPVAGVLFAAVMAVCSALAGRKK